MLIDLTEGELIMIAKQIVCFHKNRSGGNDYIYCDDCGLTWDYDKLTPVFQLRAFNHPITRGQV